MVVAVVGSSIEHIDVSPRHARGRPVETIIDPHLESAHIEVVEITVQSCVAIS